MVAIGSDQLDTAPPKQVGTTSENVELKVCL